MGICDGRVVIVTGAGGGLGREHALAFAAEGASVLVNDLGVSRTGEGDGSKGPAQQVVDEIIAAGGKAAANTDSVTDFAAGKPHGRAGPRHFRPPRRRREQCRLPARPHVRVDLRGGVGRRHQRPSQGPFLRHAPRHRAYWRNQSKAGETVDARIINTSSGAGLQGSVGQGTYSAAKGGIATLTLVQSAELGRYGVTANAIAPAARTRMTEGVFADMAAPAEGEFDENDPSNVSPLVVWLGSPQSREVTGRVFEVKGGLVGVSDGWRDGPTYDKKAKWAPDEIGAKVAELIAAAPASQKVYGS